MSSLLRSAVRPAARIARLASVWSRSAIGYVTPLKDGVHVSYGYGRLPQPHEFSHGGIVKLHSLEREFPNTPSGFNVLYLVSSHLPHGAVTMARWARRKGARVVLNQNGVAYKGWYGDGWERVNAPMRELLTLADHVFYQSAFCKSTADRFAGPAAGSWEILHNAVDTNRFVPIADAGGRALTLLLSGTHQQWYRFDAAVRTTAALRQRGRDVRLIVAGRLAWRPDPAAARTEADALIRDLDLADVVDLIGRYTPADAPEIYRRGDILLHTKYNDPCPSVVIEAMASGLPVVYSASGGVPELVGDGGIGVSEEIDFDRDRPPVPAALADAVDAVANDLRTFSQRARSRAASHLDLEAWMARHRAVFSAS